MPIVWREQMSVGVKSIDQDHQQLIALINQFEKLAKRAVTLDGDNESEARTLLGRLQTYAREHFAREERLQKMALYSGLAENKHDHDKLSKVLADMINRFQSDGRDDAKPVSSTEMVAFLNDWLVNHIIKVDLKMRGHRFPPGAW
ncbi:MAG: bacteriohemerythrin [Solirubrobacterales bacterium]